MANLAGKRPASDGSSSPNSGHDPYHHHQKRRPRSTMRFASVVEEILQLNQMQKFCSAITPMLREVVSQEVELALERAITASRQLRRSPSLRVQAPEPLPVDIPLHLVFPRPLKLPLYTGNRIVSHDSSPFQVFLVDHPRINPITGTSVTALPYPIKLEMVVLNGDFRPLLQDGDGEWTAEEFEANILRPRAGRRPLLAGDLVTSLQPADGGMAVASFGELHLTDNSSWVRSRKFRLGVRIIQGSYGGAVRIREAVSEAFGVLDHRGEAYKKHYPPKLEDEVWRLEKIGNGGPHHKNLASAGIETVHDFLKMHNVDTQRLRDIMGSKNKNLEASVKHAMTCEMGSKRYIFQGHGIYLVLDPICRVVSAEIDGQIYTDTESASLGHKAYIDQLVKVAHSSWNMLQEIDEADMHFGL